MKLWVLKQITDLTSLGWSGWSGYASEVIVRAENEEEARRCIYDPPDSRWLDPKRSTCEELVPDGNAGLVLRRDVP